MIADIDRNRNLLQCSRTAESPIFLHCFLVVAAVDLIAGSQNKTEIRLQLRQRIDGSLPVFLILLEMFRPDLNIADKPKRKGLFRLNFKR